MRAQWSRDRSKVTSRRGSHEGLQRAPTNTMLFSDHHLAKLNPKCHKNYSIIFTEISFSPETSILHKNSPWICVIKVCSNGGATYTWVCVIKECSSGYNYNVKLHNITINN